MTIEAATLQRIETMQERFGELESRMIDPKVIGDQEVYRKVTKEHSDLRDLVEAYKQYLKASGDIEDSSELISGDDKELADLAREELSELKDEQSRIEARIKELLVPKDPDDDKDVILEIRAGTGGEEAALFAGELFGMYTRYAEDKGWKLNMLSHSDADKGGLKEVVVQIEGKHVYGHLRHESGVHRVQRVPVTESQGRVHTSAVTVAVLPEAEDVDVELDMANDIKVDVFRSQGPGGQSVNTTDSAVRITHLPSGMVVTCQDEKSQHKNKAKALKILRARILDMEKQKQHDERSEMRRSQVGHGDRSEKIRTYNFPQNRITDHRANLTLHKLDRVMMGDLEDIISALRSRRRAMELSGQETG